MEELVHKRRCYVGGQEAGTLLLRCLRLIKSYESQFSKGVGANVCAKQLSLDRFHNEIVS